MRSYHSVVSGQMLIASEAGTSEHWLDKTAGRFVKDYFIENQTRNLDGIVVHFVVFDTLRILLLHPADSDDGAQDRDKGRNESLTVHSINLHPVNDQNTTLRKLVQRAFSGAIRSGVLGHIQISEYCCNNYLHELRKENEDDFGTLHIVVQVTIPPTADDGTISHKLQRRAALTLDIDQPYQYDDAIWLPLPSGSRSTQRRNDIKTVIDGNISPDLLARAIVRQQLDTARGIMKKRFDTVPKLAARLGLMFTACIDMENIRRGLDMGYILAWKHAPYGQLVIFIVLPDVVDKKVQQVDHDGVRYNVLWSGMQPEEDFLMDCGMDVDALAMILGGTVTEKGDYSGGRLLFDWMTMNHNTCIHYERL